MGSFELMVLLALLQLGDDACGVPVALLLEETLGREIAASSVYAALESLTTNGLVQTRVGELNSERGGRTSRFFEVTEAGLKEVRATKAALTTLWRGVP